LLTEAEFNIFLILCGYPEIILFNIV